MHLLHTTLLLLLTPPFAWGQSSQPRSQTPPDSLGAGKGSVVVLRKAAEPWMLWQVKHLDEFVGRFNYELRPGGGTLTDSARRAYPRETYLRLLFHEDDPRFRATTLGTPSLYSRQVEEFVRTITKKNIKIAPQPPLEAVVLMRVMRQAQPDTLRLRLRTAYRAESASLWQIVAVESFPAMKDGPELPCKDILGSVDLPPNAHELSFLSLLRGLNEARSLCPFAAPNHVSDASWWQAEAALRRGVIRVDAVLSTTLYLGVGTQWQLELKEFLYEKENSGWLISNLLALHPSK